MDWSPTVIGLKELPEATSSTPIAELDLEIGHEGSWCTSLTLDKLKLAFDQRGADSSHAAHLRQELSAKLSGWVIETREIL